MNWEKLIGVGAAAVIGGIAFVLAAFFLVRISIEYGWITPAMRATAVILFGVMALGGSELLRRTKEKYAATANALAGASIVILYTGFWAAHVHYRLIDVLPAFAAMVLVTLTAGLLAERRSSLVIAILGLAGGFLTPLLINTGRDNPIGLFGYVLLLDVGLLVLARTKKWASLQILALCGTLLLQGMWILGRMGEETSWIGLSVLAIFAGLFAISGLLAPKERSIGWLIGQGIGVLFPFAFTLYFAANSEVSRDPLPTAGLVVLLTILAAALSRKREGFGTLAMGAAISGATVMGVLLAARRFEIETTWALAGIAVLLAIVFHASAEVAHDVAPPRGPGAAAALSATFLFLALIGAALRPSSEPAGPWLAAEIVLSILLLRQASLAGRSWLSLAPAVLLPLGLSSYHLVHVDGRFPVPIVYLAIIGIAAAMFQIAAVVRRAAPPRRAAEHAAAVASTLLLLALVPAPFFLRELPPLVALGAAFTLTIFVVFSATRLRADAWYAIGLILSIGTSAVLVARHAFADLEPWMPMAAISAIALVLAAWPFLAVSAFRERRTAWRASALSLALVFPVLLRQWEAGYGRDAVALLPLSLGVFSLGAIALVRVLWPAGNPVRLSALVWFAALGLGFISVAIPLQLHHQWNTIGWALEAVAVLVLWTRIDHRGLKYFALALLAAVTIRLVANPAVLEYAPRGEMRLINWLLYTYAVPIACLLISGEILRRFERARVRGWENPLYPATMALASKACGFAAIAAGFVLLNLEVVDWFASGDRLSLQFDRLQSRDLALSMTWLGYAILLLVIGLVRRARGPRWISLALLLVSVFKVALYDMGALHDFKLVLSLTGLGATLIAVSLVYQRFLFRRSDDLPEAA